MTSSALHLGLGLGASGYAVRGDARTRAGMQALLSAPRQAALVPPRRAVRTQRVFKVTVLPRSLR